MALTRDQRGPTPTQGSIRGGKTFSRGTAAQLLRKDQAYGLGFSQSLILESILSAVRHDGVYAFLSGLAFEDESSSFHK